MGKWGGANAFLEGLQRGYEQGRRMRKDWDIASAMSEKPEESTGYTAADGEQLDAISKAVGPDGKPYYTIGNDEKGNYTVTPNFGDDPKQVVMQQGVRTAFMGKDYDGKLDESRIEAIRQGRIADVLTRYDPMEGARYRADMQRGRLTDMQIKGAERQDRRDQKQDDIQARVDAIDSKIGEYAKTLAKTDKDGNLMPFSPKEYYQISQMKTKELADAGLMDQAQSAAGAAMKFYAEGLKMESAEREADANAAVAGIGTGDFSGVAAVYNKWLPNGYDITGIAPNKDGSYTINRINKATGKPAEPMVVKDQDSLIAGVQSISDGNALIKLEQRKMENLFRQRQLSNQERQTSISGGHLSLAQAKEARDAADRQAAQSAAGNLYAEMNPGASKAKLEAVRRGILPAVPKAGEYKVESGDVTTLLGKPLLDKEGNPILDANSRPMVSRDPVKEKQFMQFMSRNNITDTNKGLLMFLGQGDAPRFNSEAEAEAAFKAGKIKSGQMVNIGGRAGTWR